MEPGGSGCIVAKNGIWEPCHCSSMAEEPRSWPQDIDFEGRFDQPGVENDRPLVTYGINRVCKTLICLVPWNAKEIKFICPCYGSQYNNQGRVVRGRLVPLSLALAHGDLNCWKIVFVPRMKLPLHNRGSSMIGLNQTFIAEALI